MNNNGGNYVYALGLDTAAFASSVDKAKRMFQGLGDTATAAGEEADEAFNKIKNSIASVAAGVSLGMLAKKVAEVRGEVQQLEVAFETMLGSKQKADALMAQMVELAAKTPFGLQDVTNGAKQLLAFGSASEEVAAEITMLGDIAAGLSIPLGDLIYLYGTTRTQGGLFTQDLRQFMSRGIPLADELAKVMGKSTDEVRELVSAGKVGFPEVQKALQGMTSEGGQFGGLMEKQSQTITGQISALEDSIYQMFNQIGESNEGLISSIIAGANWAVEHYQEILDILTVLITTYGSYKAAIMLVAAAQKALALAKSVKTFFELAKGIKKAQEAMVLLNMVTKASPIGLIASVIGAVVGAVWAFSDSTDKAAKSTERLEGEIGELEQAARDEYTTVNELAYAYEHLATSEEERAEIMSQLKDISPDLVQGMENEATAIEALTTNLAAYNDEQLREIQLNAQKDRYLTNATNVRKAQSDKVTAETNLSMDLQYLYGATRDANIDAFKKSLLFRSTESNNIFGYDESNPFDSFLQPLLADQYAAYIKKVLENTSLTELQKAEKIINWETAEGNYVVGDIPGITMATNVGLIKQAEKDLADSTNIIEAMTLGEDAVIELNDKLEKSAETAINLAEAYRTAQQAWLDAKAKVEDANKNRENYTGTQYKQLVADLDSAEKRFKELGGSTSNKAQTNAEKNAKAAAELALKLEYDAQQAVIDAMAEGTDKKVAQIELDYRKRADAIVKAEAELVAKQGTALTEAQKALFQTMREGRANDYAEAMNAAIFGDTDAEGAAAIQKMEAERKAWNKYLEEYGTFQEKLKAITIRYNEAIANAQTEGERKTLEAERDAALAAFEVQASAWAKDLANKSIAELNKMMQELEKQVEAKQKAFDALESSDSAEAKDYLKTINELKAKIAELKKQLSGASKEAKGGNWEGAAQVVQGIASAAEDAAGALEGVDDELANTINGMAKFANVAASLVSAIAAVATASKALDMALGIIGLIATAIQVVSTAIGSISQANKEYEETLNNIKALNKELAQMRELSRIDSIEGTIFGSDAFGNFTNNLNVMRDATAALKESQDAIIQRGKEVVNVMTETGAIGTNIKNFNWDSLADSLSNMQVKIRDRGRFAESWGAKDKYKSLGDMLPELFGDEGVTLEGLQKLKDSDIWEKLSKENRDLIDQMIKDWEVFNESTEAVTAYLTDIFGEMGNSINDAIVEAFMNGSDAALEFGDIAGHVIENLVKQVGYSAYIAPILTDAMAQVDALNRDGLSAEEYLNALMGIVGDAMKLAGENVEAYNEFLENADQYAESVGINTFDSERSAQSKGIAQASQDSVDELNGRMTAIQGHTYSLVEGQRQLINDSAQVLRHLAGIESNTAELRQMRLDMAAMRSDISDIATRGIITR